MRPMEVYRVTDRLLDLHIVIEGDTQGTLTLFERHDDYVYFAMPIY